MCRALQFLSTPIGHGILSKTMHLLVTSTITRNTVARLVACTVVFLVMITLALQVRTGELFTLSERALQRITERYGERGRNRVVEWQELVHETQSGSELEIIEKVNLFFNKVLFVEDEIHWKKKDYWATPVEFLGSGGGDCEDFSIAKFVTLKALGIDESKLNITYVKSLRLKQAHMVLTYFAKPGGVPLVIDNLTNQILPATKRPDLLPIYSFNGSGLWLAKQQGRGKMIGTSNRLKLWQETLSRMAADFE